MPAPSLPGFVYDEEKKRYFKIEPNHRSHSTKYTKDAIQKREQEAKVRPSPCSHRPTATFASDTPEIYALSLFLVFFRF